MVKKILFLLLTITATHAQMLTSDSKISVLTCGTGQELHSVYGHTAIRVQDGNLGIDTVFNYGMFDFATPNFYLKFVKGDLQYFVATNSFEDFLYTYQYYNRAIYEQVLRLNQNQKQDLFDQLTASLAFDQRFYTYRFIDKNCTTMVMDKLNEVYQTQLIVKKKNLDEDYRSVVNSYLEHSFYEKLGINILFGYRTDQKAEKLFLPLELLYSLKVTKYGSKNISEKVEVLNEKKPDTPEGSWWNTIYTFVGILVLIALTNNAKIYSFFLILLGLLGVLLLSIGNYSEHKEVLDNYNVFLFNPLLLLVVIFYWTKYAKTFRYLCYATLFILLIYFVFLINKAHFVFFLPMIFCVAYLLWSMMRKQEVKVPV